MGIATQKSGIQVARWLISMSVLTALALTIYEVVTLKKPFDVQQFGVGIGALLFGGGGMLYMTPKE